MPSFGIKMGIIVILISPIDLNGYAALGKVYNVWTIVVSRLVGKYLQQELLGKVWKSFNNRPTSTSHKALLEVAEVAEVLAVNLRNTFCFFLCSSMVKNFSCSAWNSLTTSPPLRMLSSFSLCSKKSEIFQEVWELTTLTWKRHLGN